LTGLAYYSISQVAARMGLSMPRVYALIAKQAIPAVRAGRRIRVPRAAFDAWLRAQEQKALQNLREPLVGDRATTALHPSELAEREALRELVIARPGERS
jgi:excisionase family DNA binding protein